MEYLGFSVFNDKSKLIKKRKNNIVTTKKQSICFFNYEIKSPLSTKERNETVILRFFVIF